MRVVMNNGVDVTDVTRNFTSDDWDKLRACGGHTYVYQRRDFLTGREGHGTSHAGRHNDRPANAEERNVAATNSSSIVEYDASTSTIARLSTQSDGDRGGRTGGRFGPSRND